MTRKRTIVAVLLAGAAFTLLPAVSSGQEQIEPYILVIVDTSSSMQGDKLNFLKSGLTEVIGTSNGVIIGMQRFGQVCTAPCNCVPTADDPSCHTSGCDGGDLIVPLEAGNQAELLSWLDGICDFAGGNPELVVPSGGTAFTPLAASLAEALGAYNQIMPSDPYMGCRPYSVVLITDGQETCCGDPPTEAANLLNNGVRTFVFGIGIFPPDAALDAIAVAGGTGPSAIYELNGTSLTDALQGIIDDVIGLVPVEVCDDTDNDCECIGDTNGDCPGDTNGDGWTCGVGDVGVCDCNPSSTPACDDGVDEDFPVGNSCDNGLVGVCFASGQLECTADTTATQCNAPIIAPPESPDEVTCDGLDNDCDGLTDEGLSQTTCGMGVCLHTVDNCSGGLPQECLPDQSSPDYQATETRCADALDNDCDGATDQGDPDCQPDLCAGVVCTASDPCHDAGACDPATGLCSSPVKDDGAPCDDQNACTQADTCQEGICTGATPVTCTASDACHTAGSCDPATGVCDDPVKPNGSACDDDNACTRTDTCVEGACVGGEPVVCAEAVPCFGEGSCLPQTGLCSYPMLPDGTVCPEGICRQGVCQTEDQPDTAGGCGCASDGPLGPVGIPLLLALVGFLWAVGRTRNS